ncbi:MAG: fumarylacetoacetate hydrolase family protein [Oscillospiraceae bacterium]|nr:fumarylacetoacetate hydrolase family protein [Oscillospiraceae bacterium]
MKFVTYINDGESGVGVLNAAETSVIPAAELGLEAKTMNELIDELRGRLPTVPAGVKELTLSDIKLDAAIPEPKQDIICLGLNYRDHAEEATRADAAFDVQRGDAVYFAKRLQRAVAPGGIIDGHFDICDSLDYEVELGVVIGKDAKNVKAADAAEYIFGYTIINDVSARNLQTRHKQWYFGKSLDDFTPIGPCIVSAEKLGAMPELDIRCYVNGELRQNSNTRMMIFDIPYIIEELSAGMTLKAGTVIATGTPSGVALGMEPSVREYLKSGDVIRCEIEGIGVLENAIG